MNLREGTTLAELRNLLVGRSLRLSRSPAGEFFARVESDGYGAGEYRSGTGRAAEIWRAIELALREYEGGEA